MPAGLITVLSLLYGILSDSLCVHHRRIMEKLKLVRLARYHPGSLASSVSFHEKYNNLARLIRDHDFLSSIHAIWSISNFMFDVTTPESRCPVGNPRLTPSELRSYLHPWMLEALTRELVLNASQRGRLTLGNWDNLVSVVNLVTSLEDSSYLERHGEQLDVWLDLQRTVQRQFPWQTNSGLAPIVRAYKVYKSTSLEEVVDRELNMSIKQFFQIGFAVAGNFIKNSGMSLNQDYGILGVSRESSGLLLERVSATLDHLRQQTQLHQVYDHNWPYAWNPIEATPSHSIYLKLSRPRRMSRATARNPEIFIWYFLRLGWKKRLFRTHLGARSSLISVRS